MIHAMIALVDVVAAIGVLLWAILLAGGGR